MLVPIDYLQDLARISRGINGDDAEALKRKKHMHLWGREFMTMLAVDLGLLPDAFEVRSSFGGKAESGEVYLDTQNFYAWLSESRVGQGGCGITYRTFENDGRTGANHFKGMSSVAADYLAFVAECRGLVKQSGASPRRG